MKEKLLRKAARKNTERRRKRRWNRFVQMLSCFVVFCTVYMMILPAVTLEAETFCGKEEHTHTEACCLQTAETEPSVETAAPHEHTDSCYGQSQALICTVVMEEHAHDETCTQTARNLTCGLEETEGHVHNEECGTIEESLICGLTEAEPHTHGEGCSEERLALSCGQEEAEGHSHGDACHTTQSSLSCTLPEDENHTHGPECSTESTVLTCGQEELAGHAHEDGCYTGETVLVCTLPEGEGHAHTQECRTPKMVYTCGQEAREAHSHTDACYTETVSHTCTPAHVHGEDCYRTEAVLICTEAAETQPEEQATEEQASEEEPVLICGFEEEHVHTLICRSDPEADVETAEIWERTLPEEWGESWPENLLAAAASQLDYQESRRNYAVTEDGTIQGYTRYGAWYGDPYGDWNAMFVSFCLHYAGVENMPLNSDSQAWVEELILEELYYAAETYTPQPGDLIFLDWEEDEKTDHVGIVVEMIPATEEEPITVKTIEGDVSGSVQSVTYALDDPAIVGYAVLPPDETVVQQELTAEIYTDETYATPDDSDMQILIVGMLPKDVQVKAFPVTVPDGQGNVICAYDITLFLPDGGVYQPEEPVTVTFASQMIQEEQEEHPYLEVYHQPAEGEAEKLDTEIEDGSVSFAADHFSIYFLLAADAVSVTDQETLEDAIKGNAAQIALANDITVNSTSSIVIPNGANITLDLNGKKLTHTGAASLFLIEEGGSLTIIDSQQPAETTETAGGDNYGNQAVVSVVDTTATLTYFVTETAVTDSAIGTTAETLKKHTVSTTGSIVGGSQPTFQVAGGTLNIAGGMIRSGTGRAINQIAGITNLSGGYICGFTMTSSNLESNEGFGGAIRISGGNLKLSGTVIAGNSGVNGGAIYATGGGEVEITGGVISGNTSTRTSLEWGGHSEGSTYRCGGGGIYADGFNSNIDMTGGYITNNIVSDSSYFDGGGGVLLSGNANMSLSGGYITGNLAQGGGGIRTDFGKSVQFHMDGGFITANVATDSEGAGVAIDRGGYGQIFSGYITNNIITNTVHWGGGGLFCADGATLYLSNALVTQNEAGGFGAGIAGCPTGHIYLYMDQGCAVYDNTDVFEKYTEEVAGPNYVGGGDKNDIDKQVCDEVFLANGHADYFCALSSTVNGKMLGDGTANWQGSADGVAVSIGRDDVQTASSVMGLESSPSSSAIQAAQREARVYVNGNYSYTHGGGILCNGDLIIGTPEEVVTPATLQLKATKEFLSGSGQKVTGLDQYYFQFELLDSTEKRIGLATCDASGNITFENVALEEKGTYTFFVREVTNGDQVVPGVTYDTTQYRITVAVGTRETWILGEKVISRVISTSKIETRTDNGTTWSVLRENSYVETEKDEAGNDIVTSHGKDVLILSLDGTGAAFTNKSSSLTKLSVKKVWAENTPALDSVTVILKKDGTEMERQTLSAANSWTYTWENLETGPTYTIEEVPIPGYTATYTIEANTENTEETSLGNGSWWVPASQLEVGKQYMIVSPDGSKALYVSDGHEDSGFGAADVLNVTQESGFLTVGGTNYTTWYKADPAIDYRGTFISETGTKDGNPGIILKNGGTASWILVQDNNGNYLKGTTGSGYSSIMVFDGAYLRGQNNYSWNPSDLRTVIFADGKFNTTTNQAPSNAAKLYTLVTGTATQTTVTGEATMVITNTKVSVELPYELPQTGGMGTGGFVLGGLMLLALGAVCLFLCKKQNKQVGI